MNKFHKLALGMGVALMIGTLACAGEPVPAPAPEPTIEILGMDDFLWKAAKRTVADDPSICERIHHYEPDPVHIVAIQGAINAAHERNLVDSTATHGNVSQFIFYFEKACERMQ